MKLLFDKLSLKSFILLSSWIDFVQFQIQKTASDYISKMRSSQNETRERVHAMGKRIETIEIVERKVSAELQLRLETETVALFTKLYEHVLSSEFKTKLRTWRNCPCPPAMDTWDETKKEVIKEIEYRFLQLLIEWESENQFCSDVHRRLVDEFLERFVR